MPNARQGWTWFTVIPPDRPDGCLRKQPLAQLDQNPGMTLTTLGHCIAGGDLQGFHTCFVASLQALEAVIEQAPASFAVLAILCQDVSESLLQRIGQGRRTKR